MLQISAHKLMVEFQKRREKYVFLDSLIKYEHVEKQFI